MKLLLRSLKLRKNINDKNVNAIDHVVAGRFGSRFDTHAVI